MGQIRKADLYGYSFCALQFIRKEEGSGGKLITVASIYEEGPIRPTAQIFRI
jgi:hypothetical protein